MDILASLFEHSPLAALFLLLILGGIGLPFPEDLTLIATGFLMANDIVRPFPALPVVYLGVLTADLLLYHIGKRFGRAVITHKRFQRILTPARLADLESRFRKNGFLFVLAGRHLIGLRPQVFLVAGIMRMRLRTFIAADALSAIGTLAVMIGIGYTGGNSFDVIRKDISRFEHAGIVILAVAVAVFLGIRYFRGREKKSS
ncbi:MAG: DedA family protein [Nitrospiraceae bacterium]|nr:DedA family protein [Nitrospiraceae bacterium]